MQHVFETPVRALIVITGLVASACGPTMGPDRGDVDGSCELTVPTDAETMENLRIIPFPPDLQLLPGESYQFDLAFYESSTHFWSVNMCEVWSIEPADAGATIDEQGFLQLAPDVEPGSVFVVKATSEHGAGPAVAANIYVWTPQTHPLVGRYTESSRTSCDGDLVDPEHPVGELEFKANGRFNVTWTPWGTYIDYSGDYAYDPLTGMLRMSNPEGEYVPPDFDGVGSAEMVPGQGLVLRNIWLGRAPNSNTGLEEACGHTFQ